jgi:hypothetical protein
LLSAAFGAAQPLGDVVEPGIPSTQASEQMRIGFALVIAGGATQDQRVLTEFVAQFFDAKGGWHAANS